MNLEKQKRAKQDIINLLNLIDEFPSLIGEESLKDYLRDIVEDKTDFAALYNTVKDYSNELHKAIDKAETSLVLLVNSNKDVQRFLQCSNIVQVNLRELIQELKLCENIAGAPKDERVKKVRSIERKKRYLIKSFKS